MSQEAERLEKGCGSPTLQPVNARETAAKIETFILDVVEWKVDGLNWDEMLRFDGRGNGAWSGSSMVGWDPWGIIYMAMG
jgi:hypothetical protein